MNSNTPENEAKKICNRWVSVSDFIASHFISFIPNHRIRHFLYTTFFNIRIAPTSTIHMGAKFFGVIPRFVYNKNKGECQVLQIDESTSVGDHAFLDLRGTIRIGKNVNISSQVMISP